MGLSLNEQGSFNKLYIYLELNWRFLSTLQLLYAMIIFNIEQYP